MKNIIKLLFIGVLLTSCSFKAQFIDFLDQSINTYDIPENERKNLNPENIGLILATKLKDNNHAEYFTLYSVKHIEIGNEAFDLLYINRDSGIETKDYFINTLLNEYLKVVLDKKNVTRISKNIFTLNRNINKNNKLFLEIYHDSIYPTEIITGLPENIKEWNNGSVVLIPYNLFKFKKFTIQYYFSQIIPIILSIINITLAFIYKYHKEIIITLLIIILIICVIKLMPFIRLFSITKYLTSIRKLILNKRVLNQIKKRLPRNNGKWIGRAGNGLWIPNLDKIPKKNNPLKLTWREILEKYNLQGINFKNGFPIFDKLATYTVEFKNEFTIWRTKNYHNAVQKLANINKVSFKEMQRLLGPVTHHEHEGLEIIQFIPKIIHENIPHDGGIKVLKAMIKKI